MRRALALILSLLIWVAGCAPGNEDADPVADEAVTDAAEPAAEETAAAENEEEGGGEAEAVAVELPGLPIGGEGAFFTEPSTQCVSVNLTGDALPEGVWVTVTGFSAPGPFTVFGGSCGLGLTGCLDGAELTASSGPCEVAVTWDGSGESGSLGVSSARARCETEERCAEALEIVSAAAPQEIGLTVQPPEEAPAGESPADPD